MKFFQLVSIKNIKKLFSWRAQIKSGTLRFGNFLMLLGALQTWALSPDGISILQMIAEFSGIRGETLTGIIIGAAGLITNLYRAKTDRDIGDK